jgi:hypothetical protein
LKLTIQQFRSRVLATLGLLLSTFKWKTADKRFLEAKALLSRCLADKTNLLEQCRKYHARTRPVFPTEIWAEIFVCCISANDPSAWIIDKAPVNLTRVCSLWRAIALDTPRIWTSLRVLAGHNQKWRKQWDVMLERSNGLPLSLQVSWYADLRDNPDIDDGFIEYFPLFLGTSSRWKYLRVFLPAPELMRVLNTSAPLLESLTVTGSTAEALHEPHSMPNLKSITFHGFHQDPVRWKLPWSQIQELNLQCVIHIDEVIYLLVVCTSVQRCHLHISSPARPPVLAPLRWIQTCSSLKVLSIDTRLHVNLLPFFEAINLPSLQELELVTGPYRMDTLAWDEFIYRMGGLPQLVKDSGSPVERLSFYGAPPIYWDLMDFVKRVRTIREVVFNHEDQGHCDVPSGLLKLLHRRSAII